MPLSVYLLSGCRAGTTFEYRVLQKEEQLAASGARCTVRDFVPDFRRLLDELIEHDLLYLYRVAYGPVLDGLIEAAHSRGIPVVFDVDDLVFEPAIVERIDPVRAMGHDEAVLYYAGVWRYRRAILASDAVTTSTAYLADRVRALGKAAFVHRNGLSGWMIAEAERLLAEPRAEDGRVVIGYGSGTATHRRDFAEAAEALAAVMAAHPEVELQIVGDLHRGAPAPLPEVLRPFAERIRSLPAVPWSRWLAVQRRFDINIAPLELGNPYCEAKSEIKYTEAAVVGVPTVASRTAAFEFAIRDGETGFLAEDVAAWRDKLEALVADAGLRRRMGAAARADVLARYSPQALAPTLLQTLERIRDGKRREREAASSEKAPLILNWIFPEPLPGSGGHRDIVRMINLLAGFGHRIHAYVVPRVHLLDKSDPEIRAFVERHFGRLEAHLFKWGPPTMAEADVVMLTHWSTAYLVDRTRTSARIFYFVQDWEPFFFPMGTEYLRAEQTYKMGFPAITLGRWLTKRLREWYGADADYFDLAVDHTIYYPRAVEKPERPRICFYARPSTPRRLFPIGTEALAIIHERRPDVEIVLYGTPETELRSYALPFPYVNEGILTEEELAELFSSCEVGIVLSPTNCSLVPPEMMACKCAVVDLDRETVMGVLEHEVNALLAEPTPEAIADAVLRLLEDKPLRRRLVEEAYRQVKERSWVKSARKVEAILEAKLPPLRHARLPHRFAKLPPLPAFDELPLDQQRRLDGLHAERRRLWRRGMARLRGGLRRLAGVESGLLLNDAPVRTVGEVRGGRRIGQRFVARQNGLCRIDLLVYAYDRRNTRDLLFRLWEGGQEVAVVRLNASLVPNRGYLSFVFAPLPDSRGKRYTLTIEAPHAVAGDAVTFWHFPKAVVAGAEMTRNGRPVKGHLVLGLFYADPSFGLTGERPLPIWTKQKSFWDRMVQAIRLVRDEGVRGLVRESLGYLRWVGLRLRARALSK